MIAARPPRVTPEAVERVMHDPPDFIQMSYLPAWRSGRFSTRALAYGVVAACGLSAYDRAVVDEVVEILEGLGYTDEPISAAVLM